MRVQTKAAFSRAIRKTDAAVVEEARELVPAIESVVDRLGDVVVGGEKGASASVRFRLIISLRTAGTDD